MKSNGSLNQIYRLIWSEVVNGWVAVAETSRGRGKGSSRKLIAAALSLSITYAQAGPAGGQLVTGAGTITQTGATTTIQQSSPTLALNWKSFNVGAQETVNFVQPSASAIALNRIADINGSKVLGNINANGQVYLINPNGVLFGAGAQVNVGGLVASTLDLNDASLSSNTRSFSGNGSGSVINQGTINAANGGYVALLGNQVSNQGTIIAPQGTVALGAGNATTLKFNGNNLLSMQVDQSVLNSASENGGLIRADGGVVLMTAGANDALLASVVSNSGVIEARTTENRGGTIILLGGMAAGTVNVGGTLDASAPNGGNGGFIETSAAHVKIANDVKITTTASTGLSGKWLIDPVDFTIAATAGDITGSALTGLLKSNSITIQTAAGTNTASTLYGSQGTTGDINVNDVVSWTANKLTLTASNNININAKLSGSGTASLALEYGQGTSTGGTSNYIVKAAIDLAEGPGKFSTKLGSSGAVKTYTVITKLGDATDTVVSPTTVTLQNIAATGNLNQNFVLGSDISAAATSGWNTTSNGNQGFMPIGNSTAKFAGTFDGLGHTISDLTINRPTVDNVGLFGFTGPGSVIQNVGLVLGTVSGKNNTGGLVGNNGIDTFVSKVNNSYNTGTVNGGAGTGGLVGHNGAESVISNSYATGAVTGGAGSGGLIGSSTTGNISNSYATGAVTGGAGSGGLMGSNTTGNISNSYATGAVIGGAGTGGLIGSSTTGAVSNSYATGAATGGAGTGGLIGSNTTGNISNSYAKGNVSGGAGTGGLIGDTTTGTISDTYATGNVNSTGAGTGGLLGTNTGTVTNSFATGNVDSTGAGTGGLLGTNTGTVANSYAAGGTVKSGGDGTGGLIGTNTGAISNSYAATSVSGTTAVGGFIGTNTGAISNSYAAGDVNGTTTVGGLMGTNTGAVSKSYASNVVTGTSTVDALMGTNTGAVTDTFWNSDKTTRTSVVGKGMTADQMKTPANFTSATAANGNVNPDWDTSIWKIDSGTMPLLRSLIKTITVTATAKDVTKTYDGTAYTGGGGVTYSELNPTYLSGILLYSGTSQGAKNVGSNYVIKVSGLTSSNAQYVVAYVDGKLTINAAPLNAVSTRAYDGTKNLDASTFTLTGFIPSETLNLTGSGTLTDKNVGLAKAIGLGGLTLGNGSGLASNYTFTGGTQTANITRLNAVSWTGGKTGNWFDPANWAGGAVPELSNVANIVIPAGVVVSFNNTSATSPVQGGTVNVDTVGSAGAISLVAGNLNIANSLRLAGLTQSGGVLNGTGNVVVDSFNQTGGSVANTGDFTVNQSFKQAAPGQVAVGGNADITQETGTLSVNSLSGKNVTLTSRNGGVLLDTVTAAGTLSINAIGDISQTSAGVITVAGVTTLGSTNGDITISNPANDFKGAVNLSGKNVAIADANGLLLNTVTTTGTLGIAAVGDIVQTPAGVITAAGTATLASTNGDITVANPANDFKGAVNLSGKNVAIAAVNGLTLNTVTTTGTLGIAAVGDIVQTPTGVITAAGTATLASAKGDITVANPANDFKGAVNLSGKNVAIAGVNGLTLNKVTTTGTLSITAVGDIVQTPTGVITAAGTAKLVSTTGDITVTNPANDFQGTLNLSGRNIAVVNVNGLTAVLNATGNTALTAGGNLVVSGKTKDLTTVTTNGGKTSFGDITVLGQLTTNSNGLVSQTGAAVVTGTSNVYQTANNVTEKVPFLFTTVPPVISGGPDLSTSSDAYKKQREFARQVVTQLQTSLISSQFARKPEALSLTPDVEVIQSTSDEAGSSNLRSQNGKRIPSSVLKIVNSGMKLPANMAPTANFAN